MNLDGLTLEDIEAAWPGLSEEQQAQFDALLKDAIPDDLLGFYALANPEYRHPEHLFAPGIDKDGRPAKSLGQTLEATLDAPQMASFSTPPQFGKTVLVLCAILWFAFRRPDSRNAYVSYNDDIALAKSDEFRKMAKAIGLQPTGPKSCITIRNGSQIVFTSVDGPLEGKPVTGLLILDDPYKNRLDAESAAARKEVSSWFTSTALGRTHPSTSVIVIGHRWTVDDLIEELIPKGWPWSNYPALWPSGRSLWESFKSAVFLLVRRTQVGPFIWESEYQGNPTAKGGRLFEGVYKYVSEDPSFTTKGAPPGETIRLPNRSLLNIAIGVDLAYTEKTSSDWSVAVVLAEYDARWYVLEVVRRQVKADVFAEELLLLSQKYPGAQMRWDGSTTERGAADLMRRFVKVPLQSVLAQGKPFNRAQLVGAAWRTQKVLLPDHTDKALQSSAVWLPEFARILTSFTAEATEDDDVAALASAHALLPAKPIVVLPKYGTPEWQARQNELEFKQEIATAKQLQQQQQRNDRWQRGIGRGPR